MDINNLELDNSIIICPFSFRTFLFDLKKKNPTISFTILDKSEFLQRLFYVIDKKAKNIIIAKDPDNYYKINDVFNKLIAIKDINVSKYSRINDVIKLKEYLLKESLMKKDEYFLEYLKNKKIIILGYPSDDNDLLYAKEKFNLNIEFVNLTSKNITHNNYYKFDNVFDELHFVFNEAAKLIDEDKNNINRIVLFGVSSEHEFLLNYFSNVYKIPVNYKSSVSLYSLPLIRDFISYLNNELFEISVQIYKTDNPNNNNLLKFIELIEPYKDLEKSKFITLITKIAKSNNVHTSMYKNAISVLDLCLPRKDDIVFILNFTESSFPKTYKEDSYLTDNMLNEIFSLTSSSKNKYEDELCSYILTNCNVYAISTLKNRGSLTCFTSSLTHFIKEDVTSNKNKEPNILYRPDYEYSKDYLLLRFGIVRDLYTKYHTNTFDKDFLFEMFKDNELLDNKVKNIKVFNQDSSFSLSYSSLSKYNTCPYRYYLEKILELKPLDENKFVMNLGNVFHYVIELITNDKTKDFIKEIANTPSFVFDEWITNNSYDNLKDFDEYYDKYLNYVLFTPGHKKYLEFKDFELILLDRYIKQFRLATKYTLYKYACMSLAGPILSEKKFEYHLDKNSLINGFVDAIVITKDKFDNKYISIIDYKSGENEFNFNEFNKGKNIQLPTYLLFAKNIDELKHYRFIGAYYNMIFSKQKIDFSNPINLAKALPDFHLKGFTVIPNDPNEEPNYLDTFDSNWRSGTYIKSLKLNASKKSSELSYYKYSKLFKESELVDVVNKTIEIYKEGFKNIRSNNFDIAPKRYKKGDKPCEHCDFKHICYVNNSQFVNLYDKSEDEGENDE